MRPYKSAVIAASALLLTGAILSAGSISVTLIGAGPANDGNYYVLPYQLSVGGTDYDADCYDAFDQIQINQTWQANELTLSEAATYGQFSGDSNAVTGYEEVAWLSAQPAALTNETTEQSQVDLQHAMWGVFDPGADFAVSTTLEESLGTAVANGFPGFDFSNYVFLEAVPGTGGLAQAFVLYMPGNAQNPWKSPEPGAMVPLLIGLVMLSVRIYRSPA